MGESAIPSQPGEVALRQFYETHRDREVSEGIMRVRDLVFPAAALANLPSEPRALTSVIADAQALARLGSRDSGKTRVDEFYFSPKFHLRHPQVASAKGLADGNVSQPVRV